MIRIPKALCLFTLLAFYCSSTPLLAQVEDQQDTTSVEEADLPFVLRIFEFYESRSTGFVPVPLFYYTPDTRWAAGAFGVYYFKLKNDDGSDTRLSFVKVLADYTQNQQLDLWASWNMFLKNESYLLKGDIRYRNFPDRFYGIGNATSEIQMERYGFDLLDITGMALKQVYPFTFVGLDARFTRYFNLYYENQDGELASGSITGFSGGNNIGLGAVAIYDSRDYVVNATKGTFFELSTYVYEDAWRSDFSYVNIRTIFNKYFEVKPNHIIAFQAMSNLNFGDPPFTNLARAGDEMILRGYANNRFRDNHFMGTQAEYRFPLWWRFGGVAFTGIGDVFGPNSTAAVSNLKYSYGAGLRFALNSKERMNVRFDYAFGRDTGTFYIMVTEAF
jgi:hypothetical protein